MGTHPVDTLNLPNLVAGQSYFVRMTAFNAIGASVVSNTVSSVPLTQPGAPQNVQLAVTSDSSLLLSWRRPTFTGGTTSPLQYFIEWYTAEGTPEQQTITTSADAGIQEVQRVSIIATGLGVSGQFVLCFLGECSVPIDCSASGSTVSAALVQMSTIGQVAVTADVSKVAIPGIQVSMSTTTGPLYSLTVVQTSSSAVNILTYLSTTTTQFWISNKGPFVKSQQGGSTSTTTALYIANAATPTVTLDVTTVFPLGLDLGVDVFTWAFSNAWTVTFQGSQHVGPQPLLVAQITSINMQPLYGPGLALDVDRLVTGEQSLSGTFTLGYSGQLTRRMEWNVDAATMKRELEALDAIGLVSVSRTVNVEGFNYVVTFLSEVTPSLLSANGNGLTGPSARVAVSKTVQGVAAANRATGTLTEAGAQVQFSYPLVGVATGTPYIARVRAQNVHGLGYYGTSLPQKAMAHPDVPVVTAITLSASSFKIVWSQPAAHGDTISQYLLQWDTQPSFVGLQNPHLAPNQQFYFSDNLAGGVQYFYNVANLPAMPLTYYVRVQAINAMGAGNFSTTVSTVLGNSVPGPVLNVTLTVLSPVQILVQWQAPSSQLLVFGGDGG